jgi:RNA polymerase-binding transcription factor
MATNSELDEKFIAQQRDRLENLKEELLRIRYGMSADERERAESEGDTQLDSGDMSQDLFAREMDATIGEQVERRLADVDRALQKIEEGTYGICDDTGEPIPRGRLEAVPEAIRTVEAQQRYERERRPPF